MCGIIGFLSSSLNTDATQVRSRILERMSNEITHRGPDGVGYFVEPAHQVYLAHRRLSIVDLATGQQPMFNEDGQRVIVFNGEIFNHTDLRPGLEEAGHRYHSHSDTETILHAYEEFGPASVERLRGMFAFAIWDGPTQTLFAARDRLGKKPFYYYFDGQTFAFASEIKALLRHPDISAAPAEKLFPEYLVFGFVSGEETLYRNIHKLSPGHWLRITRTPTGLQVEKQRYWQIPDSPADTSRTAEQWASAVLDGLEQSVRLRLMADVPLGSFLSGGLDSSAITALICRNTSSPVKTFSVGYGEARYSELPWARQVADVLATEHHEVIVSREEFFDQLPRLIWHEDEPIAWPSSVSLYFVSQLASKFVKVVLTGEGSDELFGGYERYRWHMLNQRASSLYSGLPAGLRSSLKHWVTESPMLRASVRRKLSHTFLGRDSSLESLYLDNFYGAFSPAEIAALLPGSSPLSAYDGFLRVWNERPNASLLPRLLYTDQKTYLVELLMKQDQMSMAASIESRVPFLDHQFLALSMTIPDSLKINGREQKYILKKSMEGLLPHNIIYRPKMGFPTPLRQWFADPASNAMLDSLVSPQSFLASFMDIALIKQLLAQHRSGFHDGTDRLWRLLNLELWGKAAFSG